MHEDHAPIQAPHLPEQLARLKREYQANQTKKSRRREAHSMLDRAQDYARRMELWGELVEVTKENLGEDLSKHADLKMPPDFRGSVDHILIPIHLPCHRTLLVRYLRRQSMWMRGLIRGHLWCVFNVEKQNEYTDDLGEALYFADLTTER